ncbi:MAG TPA: succinate dehydrogenase, cytochrome b556 subunit [Xanthomonadales bacterium]|nr:succinate dehydrogenase, cytochrome b556 subunit [Xanthomonadales bacterium]
MTQHPRPLSPHLQVYRWQITMAMSIFHRITGVALAIAALGLAIWLIALAGSDALHAQVSALLASLPGQVVLIAASAGLIYHLLNGIRHLIWDAGRGMSIPAVYRGGYAVIVLTVLLTAGIWLLAAVRT